MKTKTITGYKFIQADMKSKNGNHTWEVGKWYKEKDIKLCKRGFHACSKPIDSLEYIYGDLFFEVKARGKIIEEGDKFVAEEMKLVRLIDIKVFKRMAIFCAKSCLANYEKVYPGDKRVSEAITAAEDYLDNKITLDGLNIKTSAAWSAWSAAESAAWSARSARSAESAAESAARSAWSAARSAWSAARFAAWFAARSARSAWSAAESAAWFAWSAAESAANKELLKLIKESKKW